MSSAGEVAQSEWLTLALALLNVAQVVFLAHISSRSRRVREDDVRPSGEQIEPIDR